MQAPMVRSEISGLRIADSNSESGYAQHHAYTFTGSPSGSTNAIKYSWHLGLLFDHTSQPTSAKDATPDIR